MTTSQPALNRPLLGTNFFAGDVVAGLGPYLAIYLLSAYHWKPGGIGMLFGVLMPETAPSCNVGAV